MTVDVMIPVYKPGLKFFELMRRLTEQTVLPGKIIVINTEERYWSDQVIEKMGEKAAALLEVHHIAKADFDHGHTRNLGVSFSSAEVIVLMTDDAVPSNALLIENLLKPFSDPDVGAVYARQLADSNAAIAERFSREFNYPADSQKKTAADMGRLGIKTFFCSNVCAAYRKSFFDLFGGFTDNAIFNEDMVYAAKLIDHGKAVYYAADAAVIHSHAYSNRQQFSRNFDLAVSQAMHPEVFDRVRSESEGVKYIEKAFFYFIKHARPFAIFPFLVTSVNKYAGYRKGKRFRDLSHDQILRSTMNPVFFERMWKKEQAG